MKGEGGWGSLLSCLDLASRHTHKARHEKRLCVHQERHTPHPIQWYICDTVVPAIQAEQVVDDVAPVTAEYVPAKASDEEYGHVDLNTIVSVNIT